MCWKSVQIHLCFIFFILNSICQFLSTSSSTLCMPPMTARDCVLGVWRGLITQPRLFLRHCCRQPPQPQPSPHPPTIFQLLQISPIWLRAIINPTRWHNFWSQSFEQERPIMTKCSSSTYLVSSHYHYQMGGLGIFIITALNLALQSQAFRKM